MSSTSLIEKIQMYRDNVVFSFLRHNIVLALAYINNPRQFKLMTNA